MYILTNFKNIPFPWLAKPSQALLIDIILTATSSFANVCTVDFIKTDLYVIYSIYSTVPLS